MSKEKAQQLGLDWLAEIGAHAVVAGPDSSLQLQPANAIRQACAKEGIGVDALDLLEINEAFAAVGLASARDLGVDLERVNVNGGSVALGHPIGMSAPASCCMWRSSSRAAVAASVRAALCGGGGQGDALVVRVPKA
jgi:acetyl-CoA C-acetyltransferase